MRLLKTMLMAAPLLFALRLERVWDSQAVAVKWGGPTHDEFNSDFVGTLAAKYPLQENLSVIGRAGYRFQDDQPQYGVGLEYTFSYGR